MKISDIVAKVEYKDAPGENKVYKKKAAPTGVRPTLQADSDVRDSGGVDTLKSQLGRRDTSDWRKHVPSAEKVGSNPTTVPSIPTQEELQAQRVAGAHAGKDAR